MMWLAIRNNFTLLVIYLVTQFVY